MQLVGDDALNRRVAKTWPDQRLISGDKLDTIRRYRQQLDASSVGSANLRNGRRLYQETCGNCHKLFGEGGTIGPELTGAQRHDLNYWLENMVDPSANVPQQYKMSVVVTTDGRVLSGMVGETTRRTIALQTPDERLILERASIEEIRPSDLSIMPEGQLEKLSDADLRDLVAYLMSRARTEDQAATVDDAEPAPLPSK
jgi:putative heme-binding domain-containing protein